MAEAKKRHSPRSSVPAELRARTIGMGEQAILVVAYRLDDPELPPSLSSAERATVAAVMRGRSNAEAARERGLSPRTVANQLASAYRKLGVRSRAELAAKLSKRDGG